VELKVDDTGNLNRLIWEDGIEWREQGPMVTIDGFNLDDIVQSNIGDCYFMSALGAMAIREEQDIRRVDVTAEKRILSSIVQPPSVSRSGDTASKIKDVSSLEFSSFRISIKLPSGSIQRPIKERFTRFSGRRH